MRETTLMAERVQERWYADIQITGKTDRWGPGTGRTKIFRWTFP